MKKIEPHFLAILFALPVLTGCQTVNSALTPATQVTTDDFDGSKVVRQEPVSSSNSLTEDWHTLGFDWTSRTPDKVFLTIGVHGINNIFGLEFNVGGRTISAPSASMTTELGPWSTRRFVVSYGEFATIASAPMVKMKVSGANTYGVSSFGTATDALVGKKFPAFLEQVQAAR
ncbi:MAG: hypothetical protein V4640_11750 [Verrucomicrobiota bacterium]